MQSAGWFQAKKKKGHKWNSSKWSSPEESEAPFTPFHPPTGIWSLVSLLFLLEDNASADSKLRMEQFLGDMTGDPALAGETLQVRYSVSMYPDIDRASCMCRSAAIVQHTTESGD